MQILECFGFLTGKQRNSNLQTNYQLGWKGQSVIGKLHGIGVATVPHISAAAWAVLQCPEHCSVPGDWFSPAKVGLDFFNLYFNSNVTVNISFANLWCVAIFGADLVCWLAGHPGDKLQGLWMHTSEGLLCLSLTCCFAFQVLWLTMLVSIALVLRGCKIPSWHPHEFAEVQG